MKGTVETRNNIIEMNFLQLLHDPIKSLTCTPVIRLNILPNGTINDGCHYFHL